MAPAIQLSTTEMVERKVLEMAQHASFHQHVSYNLSTILHAFTAGKTDPREIAEAFSRARGLEVITRVVSGEPLARPPVVSLCCQVGRQVLDKFGSGVSQPQAGGVVEALVARLALGITGDDTQTVECQVECARLMSSVAGQAAALLIDGGALGALEGMLEQLGGKQNSILRPCCEALERVSRTEEGKTALEERGTGGVLLATIRDFPEALEEGSDAALASALKALERLFTGKSPQGCILSLRAKHEDVESGEDRNPPASSDYAICVDTVLAVVEATPEAPGAAAATCLWWLSGASTKAPARALSTLLATAAAVSDPEGGEEDGTTMTEKKDNADDQPSAPAASWSWFRCGEDVEEDAGGDGPSAPSVEGARYLAALCLCKPGIQCLEEAVGRDSSKRIAQALVVLCGSTDPLLARACLRIVERLAKGDVGPQDFVDAGALAAAIAAGKRFEAEEGAETVDDAETHAVAAALGVASALAEAGGKAAWPLVDDAFNLSVQCLERVGEFSGRPAAAVAKSALDVITIRLTRPILVKAAPVAVETEEDEGEDEDDAEESEGDEGEGEEEGGAGVDTVDAPMEVLKDAGAILAVMKAHSTDARVQQSGWRSLIAMDTGRGDVEKFWSGTGDGHQSRRQMLRDCLERHGGDSLVAGQVADILEGLVLQGDSDGDGSSLTASLSDAHGDESPLPAYIEEAEAGETGDDARDSPPSDDDGAKGSGGANAAPEAARSHQGQQSVGEGGQPDGGEDEANAGDFVSEDAEGGSRGEDGEGESHNLAAGAHNAAEGDQQVVGDLSPEEAMVQLRLAGARALDSGSYSSVSSTDAAGATGAAVAGVAGGSEDSPSIGKRHNIARSLFEVEGEGRGGGRAQATEGALAQQDKASESLSVVPSKEELKLRQSWAKLEMLHSDIVGRSQILGGENAQMVAAMPDPSALKEKVGASLEEAEGGQARDAFAAASLALIGALTSATGALASSQKEVQRYLAMSRDLRETSTWKDISDAMQWTMDSLKGTVILFTPHTSNGLTKALGLCKNMEAASKLFKEAALQIKIIVVELAGEHEPNTVWRVDPMAFEGLPENRKVMMLKHLRSLVVAYDHLSEDMRKDLTTALEIIKNREVLNMMGKYCIQSEAVDEKRRQAKLASAEERLKVGTRRPGPARQRMTSDRRTLPVGSHSSNNTPTSLSRTSASSSPRPSGNASTPPRSSGAADSPGSAESTGSNGGGGILSPPPFGCGSTSRKIPLSSPRPTRTASSDVDSVVSAVSGGGGGGKCGGVRGTGTSKIPRGVASQLRGRRETVAAAAAGPPANGHRRSKSPVVPRQGGRSKSPVPRGSSRRASRSPVPRPKKSG